MATVSGMCISELRFSGQCREFSLLLLRASLQSDHISWDHRPKLKGSSARVTGRVPESWAFFLERTTIVVTVETNTGLFKCGGCSDQCIGMCL